MQNGDEASPNIILAGRALLVKMLITFERRGIYLFQIFFTYVFLHCPATGMHNDDKASRSIILAGRALSVKMLITLETPGIWCSNFVYLCILTLSSGDEASPSIILAGQDLLVKMLNY